MKDVEYMLRGLEMMESAYDLDEDPLMNLRYQEAVDGLSQTGLSNGDRVEILDYIRDGSPSEALQYFREGVLE